MAAVAGLLPQLVEGALGDQAAARDHADAIRHALGHLELREAFEVRQLDGPHVIGQKGTDGRAQVARADRLRAEAITALVLLQPTSPLREAAHIDEAIALFENHSECESVLSVVEPPHGFHPLKALKATDEGLAPVGASPTPFFGRRDLPQSFAVNGPAVVVVRPSAIERGEMYGRPIIPYVMPAGVSIDIDEPLDLEIADFLLRRRQ